MSLNIKNPETFRLAKELAEATGQSMTAAVTEAIRVQLDRIRAERGDDPVGRVERMLAMAAEIGRSMPSGYLDQDFETLLYDEDGLPR
ncbi:MAG: type II toxin-antitoxin system VapB family antitoxin [Chloroflexota bacterium]